MKNSLVLIDASNYKQALKLIQNDKFGNPLLPDVYNGKIWGTAFINEGEITACWIGNVRGAKFPISYLAKSVYFDSFPTADNPETAEELVRQTITLASGQGIVMFNLTHWVRGSFKRIDKVQKVATFIVDLSLSEEELWKKVEPTQRNKIRKGEKNRISFEIYSKEEALKYLPEFQNLRMATQQRAISRNSSSSMLLKSNDFFNNIFLHTDSTLCIGKSEERIATVALMLQGGKTVYYYSGGSDYELNKTTGCSAYVIWKSILYFKEKGASYFDLGGVPAFEDHNNPDKTHPAYGVFQFKRSFGGDYIESKAGKVIINRFKFAILDFFMKNRKLLRILSKKGM